MLTAAVVSVSAGPAWGQKTQAEAEQELGIAETAGDVFWGDFNTASADLGTAQNRYNSYVTRFNACSGRMTNNDRLMCASYLSQASDYIDGANWALEGIGNDDSAQQWGMAGDGWIGTTADEWPDTETAYSYDNACMYDDSYGCSVSAENAYGTGGDRLDTVTGKTGTANSWLDDADAAMKKYGG